MLRSDLAIIILWFINHDELKLTSKDRCLSNRFNEKRRKKQRISNGNYKKQKGNTKISHELTLHSRCHIGSLIHTHSFHHSTTSLSPSPSQNAIKIKSKNFSQFSDLRLFVNRWRDEEMKVPIYRGKGPKRRSPPSSCHDVMHCFALIRVGGSHACRSSRVLRWEGDRYFTIIMAVEANWYTSPMMSPGFEWVRMRWYTSPMLYPCFQEWMWIHLCDGFQLSVLLFKILILV